MHLCFTANILKTILKGFHLHSLEDFFRFFLSYTNCFSSGNIFPEVPLYFTFSSFASQVDFSCFAFPSPALNPACPRIKTTSFNKYYELFNKALGNTYPKAKINRALICKGKQN